uniref:U18-Nephitoxin-Nsp1h_1 n=1 Tax=Nephila sp. SGP-2016 TaxID=1905176 RepID=A0A4Q8K0U6_9ARAC
MMKLVVLLVLIAMTTPAFAQSFQEVLQMFTNLGCKETKYRCSLAFSSGRAINV